MNASLLEELVELLRITREAERDVFGSLGPDARDAPMREGDWSPKDHQAHLTAWKARQADRYAAARGGVESEPTADQETDAINAAQQAARADWSWEDVEREADAVSERLNREILSTDPELVGASSRLIGGTFGNGPFHALTHFGWLVDAGIGVDVGRVTRFVDELERRLRGAALPDSDRGVGLYNLACYHALAGRAELARPLLQDGLRLRPDLADYALQDPDLAIMREELPDLASG